MVRRHIVTDIGELVESDADICYLEMERARWIRSIIELKCSSPSYSQTEGPPPDGHGRVYMLHLFVEESTY